MQNVANVSILAMFIMYLLTAIFGYLTFYGKGQSSQQVRGQDAIPFSFIQRKREVILVNVSSATIIIQFRRLIPPPWVP